MYYICRVKVWCLRAMDSSNLIIKAREEGHHRCKPLLIGKKEPLENNLSGSTRWDKQDGRGSVINPLL